MSPRKQLLEQSHYLLDLPRFKALWLHHQLFHGHGRLAIDGDAYRRRTRRRRP